MPSAVTDRWGFVGLIFGGFVLISGVPLVLLG